MDELAYLRPSIFLKFLSFVAVAPEIDVIRQRRSYSRIELARNVPKNKKRNFGSEQAVNLITYTKFRTPLTGKGIDSLTTMLTCAVLLLAWHVAPATREILRLVLRPLYGDVELTQCRLL